MSLIRLTNRIGSYTCERGHSIRTSSQTYLVQMSAFDPLSALRTPFFRRSVAKRIKESPYLRYIRLIQPETRVWLRNAGTLPGFLIIGAQRSGSTFLHDLLARRTSAEESPLQKEVHYFDNKYYRSLKWYSRFFDPLEGPEARKKKTFEASPYYLYHPAAPRRIRESLPNVKVVAVLRNPVDRALSQYRWIRDRGLETRGAVQAFRYDAERLHWERDPDHLRQFNDPFYFDFDHIHYGYLRRSLYGIQLQRWREHVPSSRIRVVGSDFLFNHPERVIAQLADFLGLNLQGASGEHSANQNASPSDIGVSSEARDIAETHLEGVEERVQSELTDEMVIGGELSLS